MKPICSICYEDLKTSEKIESTPCGHVYHPACLRQWVQLHKSCPDCRKECNLENLHPIYISVEQTDNIDLEGQTIALSKKVSKDAVIKKHEAEIERLNEEIRQLSVASKKSDELSVNQGIEKGSIKQSTNKTVPDDRSTHQLPTGVNPQSTIPSSSADERAKHGDNCIGYGGYTYVDDDFYDNADETIDFEFEQNNISDHLDFTDESDFDDGENSCKNYGSDEDVIDAGEDNIIDHENSFDGEDNFGVGDGDDEQISNDGENFFDGEYILDGEDNYVVEDVVDYDGCSDEITGFNGNYGEDYDFFDVCDVYGNDDGDFGDYFD